MISRSETEVCFLWNSSLSSVFCCYGKNPESGDLIRWGAVKGELEENWYVCSSNITLKIEERETDLVNTHIYLPKQTMNIEEFTFPRSWQAQVTVGSLSLPLETMNRPGRLAGACPSVPSEWEGICAGRYTRAPKRSDPASTPYVRTAQK